MLQGELGHGTRATLGTLLNVKKEKEQGKNKKKEESSRGSKLRRIGVPTQGLLSRLIPKLCNLSRVEVES